MYRKEKKWWCWGQELTELALALSIENTLVSHLLGESYFEHYLRFLLVSNRVRDRPFDGKNFLMEVAKK